MALKLVYSMVYWYWVSKLVGLRVASWDYRLVGQLVVGKDAMMVVMMVDYLVDLSVASLVAVMVVT